MENSMIFHDEYPGLHIQALFPELKLLFNLGGGGGSVTPESR
jgi:hypothetical protein